MRPFKLQLTTHFATLFRNTLPARTIMADTTALDPLFQPLALGAIAAPNRILMAPLTRGRAGRDGVPTPIMAQYYAQRASAGLIISEATGISREGLGWPYAPGLWTAQQVEGWKPVTEALHKAGGRVVAQLWHMGRVVHSDFNDGQPPVSASATRVPGHVHTYEGRKDAVVARPLRIDEMPACSTTMPAPRRTPSSPGSTACSSMPPMAT
jgi:2,4-dienoyl-CoA reductase-like NADH-dependent reductase (Old Yellow Enzyme family)